MLSASKSTETGPTCPRSSAPACLGKGGAKINTHRVSSPGALRIRVASISHNHWVQYHWVTSRSPMTYDSYDARWGLSSRAHLQHTSQLQKTNQTDHSNLRDVGFRCSKNKRIQHKTRYCMMLLGPYLSADIEILGILEGQAIFRARASAPPWPVKASQKLVTSHPTHGSPTTKDSERLRQACECLFTKT